MKVAQCCPTLCDRMDYTVRGILQTRRLEWVAFPFLQGIFPTQGSNPGLLHCRQILYQLSHQGSPEIQKRQPKHLCLILVQLALCPHCSFFVSFSPCLKQLKKIFTRSFPGGAVVENSPSNAAAEVLIPGQGTAIPRATELLSRRFNC